MNYKLKHRGLQFVIVFVLAMALVLSLAGCNSEETTATQKEVIMFADNGWDSCQVHNRIAAFIAENGYGYPASEYTPGETVPLMAATASGDVDINMEIWVENVQEAYDKQIADGSYIDLGGNFTDNWQGWLVPAYVVNGDPERGIEALAPDLKSVFDLPEYWEIFKDPEDPSKGRFYSCIPGWQCEVINESKFKEYGLDETYNIFLPGSGAALAASMVGAYEKGEPWLGYYWAPTWILGQLDMIALEEPAYDTEIWATTSACAYPAVNVNIVVNSDFAEKNPDVVAFLRNYVTTTEQNNKFLAYMQENETSAEEAAKWFLREYESEWTTWVPADIAQKVKAALQ